MSAKSLIWNSLALKLLMAAACGASEFPFTPDIDLYIDSSNGNAKVDDNFLDVGDGAGGAGQDDRALVKFDFSSLGGASVNSATLHLNQVEMGNADRFGAAQVRHIGTMNWDETETGATLYSLARDANTVSLGNFSPATNPPSGPKTFDLTGTVSGWVDGSFANYGISVLQASEGFTGTQRRFLSENAGGSAVVVDFTGGPMAAELSPTMDLYIDQSAGFAKVDNGELNVGHAAAGVDVDDRALLKFDVSSLAGATIHAATLTLNQEELGTADRFGVAQLRTIGTSDWDGSETGLALFDLARDANTDVIGNFSPAQDPPGGPYFLDLTELIQAWVDGSTPNFGLSLLQASEGFGNTGRRFTSSDGNGNGPLLSVLFTPTLVPEPNTIIIWAFLGVTAAGIGYLRLRRGENGDRSR